MTEDWSYEQIAAWAEEMGLPVPPPPPPGYGVGVAAPEWMPRDTFTGRRSELRRVRSVMWQHLQKRLAKG